MFFQIEFFNFLQNLIKNRIYFNPSFILLGKILLSNLINGVDYDDDGFLTLREITSFILDRLKLWNINISPEVQGYVNSYLDLVDTSIKGLLRKYELKDVSQCILFFYIFINIGIPL